MCLVKKSALIILLLSLCLVCCNFAYAEKNPFYKNRTSRRVSTHNPDETFKPLDFYVRLVDFTWTEYVENKETYKKVVPVRHEPLLELCNTYRRFSVYPKKQKITGMLAASILSLSIEFLIDPDTKPEVTKTRLNAAQGGSYA